MAESLLRPAGGLPAATKALLVPENIREGVHIKGGGVDVVGGLSLDSRVRGMVCFGSNDRIDSSGNRVIQGNSTGWSDQTILTMNSENSFGGWGGPTIKVQIKKNGTYAIRGVGYWNRNQVAFYKDGDTYSLGTPGAGSGHQRGAVVFELLE